MTMSEIVSDIAFMLGQPANINVEGMTIEKAVLIAFRELKRYIKTPVDKTVSFALRIDLPKVGINTNRVLYVQAAYPRSGLTLGSIESGNVFQTAAAVSTYSAAATNIDPIITEMAATQVRNTLSSNFQWKHDLPNQVVYCTHSDPKPSVVTIRYVPKYEDVSELINDSWIDYLIRMGEANMKKSLGRSRSKYRVEGSNVSNDGEALLAEANAELEQIRAELAGKKQKLVVLN